MLHQRRALFSASVSGTATVPWHGPLLSGARKARSWCSRGGAAMGAGRAGEQRCPLQRFCMSSDVPVFLCCQSPVRMLIPLWETK